MVYVCVCMCVCVCVCVCDLTLGLRLLYFGGAGHAPSIHPITSPFVVVPSLSFANRAHFPPLAVLGTLTGTTFSR